MAHRSPTDAQAEALIAGDRPDDADLAGIADALDSVRSLADRPVSDEVVARHVALLAVAAASTPSGRHLARRAGRRRRRLVLNTMLSGLVAKTLAAGVALAAVGAVGVAANASAPGDPLYGLDRAMEVIGIGNGGAGERLAEAKKLVDRDLATAVETAAEAADEADGEHSQAGTALHDAAQRILTQGSDQSADTRQQVSSLLDEIAGQLESGSGVDGKTISEKARNIRPDVSLPEQTQGRGDPPTSVPPVVTPTSPTVPTTAGAKPPAGTPPVHTPPVSVPPANPPGKSKTP